MNSAYWSGSDHKCYPEAGEIYEDREIKEYVTGELGAREDVSGKA